MLVDMATDPITTEIEDQHILDYQLPAGGCRDCSTNGN